MEDISLFKDMWLQDSNPYQSNLKVILIEGMIEEVNYVCTKEINVLLTSMAMWRVITIMQILSKSFAVQANLSLLS